MPLYYLTGFLRRLLSAGNGLPLPEISRILLEEATMNRTDDSQQVTRRAALSTLFAGSAAALLPRRGDAAPLPDSPTRYELTDLGTLPGQTSSGANVINNRGQIGGWASNGGQYAAKMHTQAVLWTDRAMHTVNSSTIPVYLYTGKANLRFKVDSPGSFSDEALQFAQVTAVNERGDALVSPLPRASEGDNPHHIRASGPPPVSSYFWSAKDQKLFYVYDYGNAYGLLEDGTVLRSGVQWREGKEAPYTQNPWPMYQPERVDPLATQRKGPSEQAPLLGTILHFPLSEILTRNSKGQVLGQVMREMPPKPGDNYPQYEKIPVLWEADGTPRVLDEARMNNSAFTPLSVNKRGEVVGATNLHTFRPCAHVYTRGKLFDLNTLIAPEVALEWKMTEARGINDRGQIVGNAKKGGYTRAFLLTPR
ncbi:MAG: hypothetical protein V4671_12515 [Armatimonadota bacterium]